MLTKKCENQIRILLLFCPVLLFAQLQNIDFQLNGNIESVQTKSVIWGNESQTSASGFLETEDFDSVFLKFDRKGNLILRKNFLDYQGKLGLFDQTGFQFNAENKIEFQETELIQNGEEPRKISQRKIYYYIENQLARIDEFNFGRTTNQFWATNFIYDGGRLKKKEFWMEDKIFSTTEFENRLMKVISEKTIHNDGKTGKTIQNQYDGEYAKLILKSTFSGNEKTEESFEYNDENLEKKTIRENGKIIFTEILSPDGLPSEVQKINYKTGKLDSYQFKFEFDSQKNWINCVILENQKPKFKVIRKIKYYSQKN
jgi:hypothetical protein